MDDFYMPEFKCLKTVFIFNFLIIEACALKNLLLYYTGKRGLHES